MTITSKDLSQPAGLTGVARDEAEKKLAELKELQAKIDKLKFISPNDPGDEDDSNVKKKTKQKKK